MTFKKNSTTLLLLSMTSLPLSAIADDSPAAGEASGKIYASIRAGIATSEFGDNGDRTTEVVSRFSRVGFEGESDIGNGLTAFGHYQTQVDIVNTNDDGANLKTRLGFIGLKGDWGSLRVGQDYHTFYNYNVAAGDIPWNYSGFAQVTYRGRTEQTLSYDGSFGNASLGASFVLDDEDNEDNVGDVELGFSYNFGPVTASLAGVSAGDDREDIVAAALNGSIGSVDWYVGYQEQDENGDSITFDITAHDFYFHTEQFSGDNGVDPTLYTLGYTLTLNDQASIWFEYGRFDDDVNNSGDDEDNFEIIFKYDIGHVF